MRSMQKARPMISAAATSDIKPLLPSINLSRSVWCSPVSSSWAISGKAIASIVNIATDLVKSFIFNPKFLNVSFHPTGFNAAKIMQTNGKTRFFTVNLRF